MLMSYFLTVVTLGSKLKIGRMTTISLPGVTATGRYGHTRQLKRYQRLEC